MASREQAQQEYDEAKQRYEDAYDELAQAREALEVFLKEDEARNRAVYEFGVEEPEDHHIEAAKAMIERRENEKALLAERAADGPVDGPMGGLS